MIDARASNGVSLSVLDLLPRSSGDDAATALRNAVDLARAAEAAGYQRLWYAEHHLNPGVLGASPALVIALVGHATSRIRLGSAGVQFGHRTPLATVEEFGLLDAAFPGRLDLGIGRSPSRPAPGSEGFRRRGPAHREETRAANGLLLPAPYAPGPEAVARLGATLALIQQPGAYAPAYDSQVSQVLALLAGTYRDAEGRPVGASPGEGADVEVWILGASAGESAEVAARHGLPFVASYHHTPSSVVEATDAYRAAFRPSPSLAEPHVAVSVDAVAAPDASQARELVAGYGAWVRSIRAGEGAIAFPSATEVAALPWSAEDADMVQDRVRTQAVGTPVEVADQIAQIVDATGASEVAITAITHDHGDRVRSYELIAEEWARR